MALKKSQAAVLPGRVRPEILQFENMECVTKETAKRLRGFYGHKDETTVIVSTTLALRPGESYGMRIAVFKHFKRKCCMRYQLIPFRR